MEEKDLRKAFITVPTWWNSLEGIYLYVSFLNYDSQPIFIVLGNLKVYSFTVKFLLEKLCALLYICPVAPQPPSMPLEVEGICWHFSYRCTSWLQWIAFCLNSRTFQGLTLQGAVWLLHCLCNFGKQTLVLFIHSAMWQSFSGFPLAQLVLWDSF